MLIKPHVTQATSLDEMYTDWYNACDPFEFDERDFYYHVPTLKFLARDRHVLEVGIYTPLSTLALLAGKPRRLISVDPNVFFIMSSIEELARKERVRFSYYEENYLTFPAVYPTLDFHDKFPSFCLTILNPTPTYTTMRTTLDLYAPYTCEYLVLHNVTSFGYKNEDTAPGKQGIMPAITEFIEEQKGAWSIAALYTHNNGLMILKRETWHT